jgi:ABC-type multidrug transport system ATPase subunit
MGGPLYIKPDSLVAENVFLSVGKKDILKGVTIRADKGKITGLLGRNGSGKTTLLQCLFGTRRADECDVFVNGKKTGKPYLQHGLLNYLPQRSFLPPRVTIKHAAEQFGIKAGEMLEYFPDLETDMHKKAAELSGGRERLFSVLIILLADTRFSLLDEPFSHIMPLHVEALKKLIVKQKEKKGIVITDHMYRHLLDVSDQIYLMKDGQSMFIKDIGDLILHKYIHPTDQ